MLNDGTDDAEALWSSAQRQLDTLQTGLAQPSEAWIAEVDLTIDAHPIPRVTAADYRASVERSKQYIRDGDVFQVVISQRFDHEITAEPIDVYRVLRALNPSPYMYLLTLEGPAGDSYSIVGSSPEALVKVQGGRVFTHPIAGSRPRGETPERDLELADELLADPKEQAEHLMLVDLARNDLSKVCVAGSVEVTEFMQVERFSHIMHLVSSVEGDLAPDATSIDVFRATFPAGTLSGAPKPARTGDHRRARGRPARCLRWRRRLLRSGRGRRPGHRDPDRHDRRRARPRAGRSRSRRRLGPGDRAPRGPEQGRSAAQGRRHRQRDAEARVTGGRSKASSLVGIVILAALVFLAWSQTWFTLTVQEKPFVVAGSVAGSALAPIALASLALVAALAIAGPFFRVILGVLLALLGVCVVVVSAFAIAHPVVAATAAITKTTGVAGAASVAKLVTATSLTAWPVVAIVIGVLLALLGLLIVPTSRRWPESGRKYTRSRLVDDDAEGLDAVQEWDALSEGDDPTRRSAAS